LTPGVNGTIDEANRTITLNVPFGTDVTALVPTITTSSGTTINPSDDTSQDFSSPVIYTVTATDLSTQTYTVNVAVAPPTQDPVIIIPGIMGTELIRDYGDKNEIWPNILNLIIPGPDLYLNDLSFLSSGKEDSNYPIKAGDIIRSIKRNIIFDGLISELENSREYKEGKNLFVFPYDWRFSNVKNAELLKEKIDQVLLDTGKEKVDIVAHSMGGLLSKEYIRQNGKEKVDHLIFLGTPHLGAPKALKTLVYGDDMGISIGLGLLGLNANRVKEISQNMPSIYELLPSRKYVSSLKYISENISSSEIKYLDYDSTENFLIEKETNADMLEAADTFHQNLDDLDLSGIKVSNISACGEPTISAIHIKKKAQVGAITLPEDYSLDYANGDETVPLDSSFGISNVDKYFVNEISHSALPSAPDVPDAVLSILENKPRKINSIVFTDINNCTSVHGTIVSIHSPITLDIYDEDGNHSGLDTDGDIENNIKGVSYDTIGEAKFAFIPEGVKVEVKGGATDSGTFDLAIEKVEGGETIETKFWNDVPIASTSQMNFNLDSYDDLKNIEVETGGNKTNLSNSNILKEGEDYLGVPAEVQEEDNSSENHHIGGSSSSYILKPVMIIPKVEIDQKIPPVLAKEQKPAMKPVSLIKKKKDVAKKIAKENIVVMNKKEVVGERAIFNNTNLSASVINAGQEVDLWGTIKLLFKKLFTFKK
ncbi:alpha/beta fold hydrolase, partial [Candidatus Nomurabacteria bacterium]|nr:alpha/beta fold hydrolase [Candidatus Nomurabacteria bacterium]